MAKTKESIARNVEVRRLLAEGKAPAEVAKLMGVTIGAVYSVRSYDRSKAQKARATPAATGAPRKLGRPKGSKNKKVVSVDKVTLLELDRNRLKDELFDTKELNEQLIRSLQEATTPKIVYREVSVPQPFSHYTFLQRLRILFLGRAA